VSIEQVAHVRRCEESASARFPVDDERWQTSWIDNGPDELLVFYCTEFAERKFGASAG